MVDSIYHMAFTIIIAFIKVEQSIICQPTSFKTCEMTLRVDERLYYGRSIYHNQCIKNMKMKETYHLTLRRKWKSTISHLSFVYASVICAAEQSTIDFKQNPSCLLCSYKLIHTHSGQGAKQNIAQVICVSNIGVIISQPYTQKH